MEKYETLENFHRQVNLPFLSRAMYKVQIKLFTHFVEWEKLSSGLEVC